MPMTDTDGTAAEGATAQSAAGQSATESESIRAVLIDDHRVFLDGFENLLERDGRIRVVGSSTSSADGIDTVRRHRPELVVLDVDIDGTPVEQNLRQLLSDSPESAVVIVSMHNFASLREALLRGGARAYLSKSTPGAVLIDALVDAVRGPAAKHPYRFSGQRVELTPRENQVLRRMSLAQTNRQIGKELGVTETTVKHLAYSLFKKLGATSRMDAVRKASDLGLLDGGHSAR